MRSIGAYEAKTHLPRLLDEVAAGETITITKRGRAVAVLAPVPDKSGVSVDEAIAGLRQFRAAHPLRNTSIRSLVDDGRR